MTQTTPLSGNYPRRCPVCRTWAEKETCPTCRTDKKPWAGRSEWYRFRRFPLWVAIVASFLLLGGLALTRSADLWGYVIKSSLISATVTVLPLGLSLILALAVYFLKIPIAEYEVGSKVKHRRPGLIPVAIVLGVVGLVCSAGIVIILLLLSRAAQSGLLAVTAQDGQVTPYASLLPDDGVILGPQKSPDGRWQVYAYKKDGDWDIYKSNPDGTNETPLTYNEVDDYAPAWADGSSKIVFVSKRSGTAEIWIMDPEGQGVENLSQRVDSIKNQDGLAYPRELVPVLSSPTFATLLAGQAGFAIDRTAVLAALYGAMIPCLTLAVMLVGVKLFAERWYEDFRPPIYADTDLLAAVALESVRARLPVNAEGDEAAGPDACFPLDKDFAALATSLEAAGKAASQRLRGTDKEASELIINTVSGSEQHALEFVFRQKSDPHQYLLEIDRSNTPIHFGSLLPNLRIVSLQRTHKGGLKMMVARHSTKEIKPENDGQCKRETKEKRYEVETDQWGHILNMKELTFDTNRGKWA